MEIKKGDVFECIEDVVMFVDGRIEYFKGKYYNSDNDGSITNESGDEFHNCGSDTPVYFRKLSDVEVAERKNPINENIGQLGDKEQKVLNAHNQAKYDNAKRMFESGSSRDDDSDKPLVNHLDPYTRLRFGTLLRKGANHYGKNNWRLGQPTETAIESLNRHLALYELGDRNDDHLSAIIFNVQLIMKNEEKEGIKFDHYK